MQKKTRYMLIGAIVLGIVFKLGVPYANRHFKEVKVDVPSTVQGEKVKNTWKKPLIVYFTRVGNTDFVKNVEAVSGASLLLDSSKQEAKVLVGNTELLAKMAQNAVGGELLPITVAKKYSSSYKDTVLEGKKEMEEGKKKLNMLKKDLSSYDAVLLVYPIWYSDIPLAVKTFLEENDLSGKKLIPLVTDGGSGLGKSIESIKKATKAEVVEKDILNVYCEDIPKARGAVGEYLKKF